MVYIEEEVEHLNQLVESPLEDKTFVAKVKEMKEKKMLDLQEI
jgi:hypothetical protein